LPTGWSSDRIGPNMQVSAEVYEVTVLEGSFGWQVPHLTDAASTETIRRAIEAGHDLVRIAVCHRRTGAVKRRDNSRRSRPAHRCIGRERALRIPQSALDESRVVGLEPLARAARPEPNLVNGGARAWRAFACIMLETPSVNCRRGQRQNKCDALVSRPDFL